MGAHILNELNMYEVVACIIFILARAGGVLSYLRFVAYGVRDGHSAFFFYVKEVDGGKRQRPFLPRGVRPYQEVSSIASSSFYAAVVPLVGGRLRHFAHKWKSLLLTPPSLLQCS